MGSRGIRSISRNTRALLATTLALFPLFIQSHSSTVAASASPMYAYTSANSGHYSFKIEASDNPTNITTVGDFGITCGNMNLANHAGTKVYQSYNCNGSNKKFTEIDVATNAFQSFIASERTHTIALSPDDRYLYYADPYYIFKSDISTNPPTQVAGSSRDDNNAGLNLGILPNGQKLYSASVQRSKVHVFDSNLNLVATVSDAAFNTLRWTVPNPSGTEVWVGFGTTYKIIDTATDTISRTINATYATSVMPSFSSDGAFLYTSSGSGLEKVDTTTGTSVHTYTGTGLANGTHAAISPDGKYVYVANGASVGWVNLISGLTGVITLPAGDTTKTIAWAQPLAAPSITLSSTSLSGLTNTALSTYTITNSGGAISSYSITPALPSGLTFSTSTGLITGTPTVTNASTTYTVTATNVSGTSTATFTLAITDPPAPSAQPSASTAPLTHAVSTTKKKSSQTSISNSSIIAPTPEAVSSALPTASPSNSKSTDASQPHIENQTNPIAASKYVGAGGLAIVALAMFGTWLMKRR